jgi:hypothetical protein
MVTILDLPGRRPGALPQSSADLFNELLSLFAEFLAQPFRERRHATIEDIGNV